MLKHTRCRWDLRLHLRDEMHMTVLVLPEVMSLTAVWWAVGYTLMMHTMGRRLGRPVQRECLHQLGMRNVHVHAYQLVRRMRVHMMMRKAALIKEAWAPHAETLEPGSDEEWHAVCPARPCPSESMTTLQSWTSLIPLVTADGGAFSCCQICGVAGWASARPAQASVLVVVVPV